VISYRQSDWGDFQESQRGIREFTVTVKNADGAKNFDLFFEINGDDEKFMSAFVHATGAYMYMSKKDDHHTVSIAQSTPSLSNVVNSISYLLGKHIDGPPPFEDIRIDVANRNATEGKVMGTFTPPEKKNSSLISYRKADWQDYKKSLEPREYWLEYHVVDMNSGDFPYEVFVYKSSLPLLAIKALNTAFEPLEFAVAGEIAQESIDITIEEALEQFKLEPYYTSELPDSNENRQRWRVEIK